VPKLGYRWEGPAGEPELPEAPALPRAAPPRRSMAIRLRWLVAAGLAGVALATAWFAAHRPASAPPAPIARPLLREPAQESEPDLSRDGRQLAYVRADAARFELRLRTLAPGGGERERTLAAAPDATLAAPRFSRAGDRIAYLRRTPDTCEVHVLALAGATDQLVAGGCPYSLPTSMDWSADDAWLYLTRPATGAAVAQRSLAIHRVRVADGQVQRISDAGRWLSVDVHPRLSADGRTLAFVRDGDGRNRVVTMPAEGGPETEVPFALWPYRAAWDGDDFVLAMHGSSGLELWRGDRQGRLIAPLAREGAGPGLALAGDRVVFERQRADDNLWRLDLRDPGALPVQLTQETGSEHSPRLAPDGNTLAYLSDASGDLEVHVRDLAAGTRRAWTALAPRVPLDLRWSPDGTRALLVLGTDRGKRLALLQADGALADLAPGLRDLAPAQIEWDRISGDWWIAAERDGRRELLRARAPAFARAELVVDGTIAAFALAGGETWLRRPDDPRFVSLDGKRAMPVAAVATPGDQWAVDGPWLVQGVQRGGGQPSRLQIDAIDGSGSPRTLPIAFPEPPLGRHFDVANGVLVYARRDRVEADLYELRLPRR
jgi:Tol biopolymer transport system component